MNRVKREGAIAIVLATAFVPRACAAPVEAAVNVPYVGCASDGQFGPQPPPKPSRPTPSLPPAVARRVAYFASANNGILAPRGWSCFSVYGSSGTTLWVTPKPVDKRLIFDAKFKLKGDVVELTYTLGGTSGRFEVAEVSSGLFPVARDFVKSVVEEEKDIGALPLQLSRKPFPNDLIGRRTDTVVQYTTPPRKEGLGTHSNLCPNATPIDGLAELIADGGDFDLIELNVRLPQRDRDLVTPILATVEANHGDSLTDAQLLYPDK